MLLIDKLSGKPVYEQIIEGVEKNVLMGIYPPGSLLPSMRELSVSLGINPNTIQKSYAELTRRGVIVPAPGSGCYVAPDAHARIRAAAAQKMPLLEELVAELAIADVPRGEVLAMVSAVYARIEKSSGEPSIAQNSNRGGTPT